MKIQVMSDLHLDLRTDRGRGFIEALDPSGVDVLVLAGDLAEMGNESYGRMVRTICKKYPEVVYVLGNHEWWGSTREVGQALLAELATKYGNFHILQDRAVTLGGQRFVGSTLWWGKNSWSLSGMKNWIDCKKVPDLRDWVWEAERSARKFLEDTILETDVVVTHYLPLAKSLDPRFLARGDLMANDNCFYINDMAYLFQKRPLGKLWIHGHTHWHFDYMAGDTRVLCNPLGNPGEPTDFVGKMVVEV